MRNALIILSVLVLSFTLFGEEKKYKVAVMEIEDKSGKLTKSMLDNAAEYLRSELAATNKFALISKDRQNEVMKKVRDMRKMSYDVCRDQTCQIQLGREASADSIMIGTTIFFGGTYSIAIEMIDLEKAMTVKAAKGDFDGSEKSLRVALDTLVASFAGKEKPATETSPTPTDTKPASSGLSSADRYEKARDIEKNDPERATEIYRDILETTDESDRYRVKAKERLVKLGVADTFDAIQEQRNFAYNEILKEALEYLKVFSSVVVDTRSGKTWQRISSDITVNHYDAINYCENLDEGGFSDWRLPTVSELRTLILGCPTTQQNGSCGVNNSCLTSNCFSNQCSCKEGKGPGENGYYTLTSIWMGGSNYFWASELRPGDDYYAWSVGFYKGDVRLAQRPSNYNVRCIRKGQQ